MLCAVATPKIKDWPEDERPREKLMQRGAEALSDAELLAIFLRTGTPGRTAIDVGDEMINGLRAAAEFRIGEAQDGDVSIGEIDDGRLVRRPPVENLGQILVTRRREQGLTEEDWLWKAVAHGIRRSEKLKR